MKVYTKQGDGGMTSLMNGIRVSKWDERVELLGTLDELNSHIGLAKAATKGDGDLPERLSKIQRELMSMMAQVAAPSDVKYALPGEQIAFLENEIDRIDNAFPRKKEFVLYGGCELSARLDVARAVARRAERRFHKVAKCYRIDANALKYMNRLSDYLYIEARYADYQDSALF